MRKARMRKFYQKHVDAVYRYVFFRVGRNKDVAEDLTSEIFIKVVKHFDSYDPKRSEKAWIMTIAKNHLANYYRDSKQTEDIDDHAYRLEGVDGNEHQLEVDDKELLEAAMVQLTGEERRLVEMKYIEGYRYKEMAEIIGKTPGAVRIQTYRAMQRLKELIQPRYANSQETIQEIA